MKNAVRSRKIAITQADKGGCILIVDPELILSCTVEKLNVVSRYTPLGLANPLHEIRSLLITLWKYAFQQVLLQVNSLKKLLACITNLLQTSQIRSV